MKRYLIAGVLLLSLAGCTRLYYSSMEKFGKEKRDILVSRIIDGRKQQEEAKKQVQSTLEAFQSVTGFEGGDLEKVYKKLNGEYERVEDKAKKVSDRIASIDQVAGDLFREWDKEIDTMRDDSLKTRSERMLRDMKTRHRQYMVRMRETEKRMQPVVQAFHDQVLYLKHNLNAKAIASLKRTSAKLDTDVSALVKQIEVSMQEADAFIATLQAPA